MKRPFFLSIVMPAYNEQAHIEAVIREHIDIVARLSDSLDDWEIVCLDDGSQDDTAEIVSRLSEHTRMSVWLCIRRIRNSPVPGRSVSQRPRDFLFPGSDGGGRGKPHQNVCGTLCGSDLSSACGNRSEIYNLRRRVISYGFNSDQTALWPCYPGCRQHQTRRT
jgi:glycosyltransferase involved in cell wall biosynthesis